MAGWMAGLAKPEVGFLAPSQFWFSTLGGLCERDPTDRFWPIACRRPYRRRVAPPTELYRRAATLDGRGKRDEGVFWFHPGRLRYRFHLAARPACKPDGDPALFGALSEQVGRPMNEWAFSDPDALVATLDQVLAGDTGTPNAFTPKDRFAGAFYETRVGRAARLHRRRKAGMQRMPNRAGR